VVFSNSGRNSVCSDKGAAFLEGMKKLKERANKCIDQGGMYFEE